MLDTAKADEHARETNLESRRHIAAMMFATTRGKPEPGESVSSGKTKMQKACVGELEVDVNAINLKAQDSDEHREVCISNGFKLNTMFNLSRLD